MSVRCLDLAISVRVADVIRDAHGRPRWDLTTDHELARLGGRYDRRRKRWSTAAPATRAIVLRFHRGQEDAARWFVDWLRRFVSNDWQEIRRAWSLLLIGGRRSGKTHLACAALVLFATINPGALLWAISPTIETGDELAVALVELMPRGWYKIRAPVNGGKTRTFRLANGSRILLKSAVKPERLKAGRVDLALLNEAQELDQRAYVKLRAPIADRGGLVLLTANPPDTARGRWIEEHYTATRAGSIESVCFELDPARNPWINYEALASIGKEIDAKTYQRDVLGLFPPIGDIVFHAWSDRESIRPVAPGLVDVTAEITKRELGRAFGVVIGVDLQQTPHMAAAVLKFFRDPADPDPASVLAWVVAEAVVDDADEDDLIDELELQGFRGWAEPDDDPEAPVVAACVLDASAWWQDGAHSKGKTSDRRFRDRGWSHLFKPQRDSDRNPDIVERCKITNARLESNDKRRRLFSAPANERINRAMGRWENRNGAPNRRSDFAHLADAVSYVVYRIHALPKKKRPRSAYHGAGRFDRAALLPPR